MEMSQFQKNLNLHLDVMLLQPQGEKIVDALAIAYSTCCVKCDIRNICDLAFDPYNQGEVPKLTCLAAK